MRLIVDKQPKESSDCLFYLNDGECIHGNGNCSYLKEYKPNKVSVKINRKYDKK